jgi:hypothetical protein
MTDLETFAFGDSPALADELLALVLAGKKTATCWAASEGGKGVEIGKRWIVKDGQGRARAVVETVELTRRRFKKVDAAFAFDEGEGTGRLAGGGARIRIISPDEASLRRAWRFIASGSGLLRSSTPNDGGRYPHAARYPSPALREKVAGASRPDEGPLHPSTNSLREMPWA